MPCYYIPYNSVGYVVLGVRI